MISTLANPDTALELNGTAQIVIVAVLPALAGLGRGLLVAARGAAKAAGAMGRGRAGAGGGSTSAAVGMGEFEQRTQDALMQFAKLSVGVGGLVVAIPKLSDVVLESRRKFARFNGAIATAFVELERGRLGRQFATAGATSESTARLADSMNRFEQTVAPLKVTVINLTNAVLTTGLDLVNNLAMLSEMIPGLGSHLQQLREEMEQQGRQLNERQFRILDVLAARGQAGDVGQTPMEDLPRGGL